MGWATMTLPPPRWLTPLAHALDVTPQHLTLAWNRVCIRNAAEVLSVWHLRQQLTRRKRAKNHRG